MTWAQIEQIDSRLAQLAYAARQRKCGVQMFLQVNENGMLVTCGQPMAIEKIRPAH